ncbi:MAG: o-succinylbenzoate synthase [Phycisphaerae bacterium]|nr:o-succinylbenzoate synthase [Phycisphaerae bacterium]
MPVVPTIDAIKIYRLKMPLVYPFRTAYGSDDAVGSVVVKLVSGGSYGWGESQPFRFPTYGPEYSAGVFLTVREVLAPVLLGREIDTGETLQELLSCFKGNFFAKAALDMAWWDLHARLTARPLWQAIGGRGGAVDVGADFGAMETINALLAMIDEAVKAGFKRVKLKYAPGWDLHMVDAVRRTFPKTVFHIDCNSGYSLKDVDMFRRLDRFHLAMIEQPLMHDDLVDHATLQKQIETPICLDESITSPHRVRQAIEIGACRWVNIKPCRVGGLTPALRIQDLCLQAGVPCWVGGMLESALGARHCMAMASLPNIRYPSDIFPSSRFFRKDMARPEIVLSGPSQVTLPDVPGVGAEPDPTELEHLTVERACLELERGPKSGGA